MIMKKLEFSKILTIAITIFFFGVIVFSLIYWAIEDRVPDSILSMISIPFSSVTGFYFLKAGYENGKKIDGGGGNDHTI